MKYSLAVLFILGMMAMGEVASAQTTFCARGGGPTLQTPAGIVILGCGALGHEQAPAFVPPARAIGP